LAGDSHVNGGFVIRYIEPNVLKTEIAGHEAREKIIRKSELNWTIVIQRESSALSLTICPYTSESTKIIVDV
jgi:hypothetical protein